MLVVLVMDMFLLTNSGGGIAHSIAYIYDICIHLIVHHRDLMNDKSVNAWCYYSTWLSKCADH